MRERLEKLKTGTDPMNATGREIIGELKSYDGPAALVLGGRSWRAWSDAKAVKQ